MSSTSVAVLPWRRAVSHPAPSGGAPGLSNRVRFEQAIDAHITLHGVLDTAVGVVDVNRFTEIRTRVGETSGEALLLAIEERLSVLFNGRCFVMRLGADMFGVVGKAGEVAHQRLNEVCARSFVVDDQSCQVSVSIGIAFASECDGHGRSVLLAATLAIKMAKAQGYGGRAYYSRQLGTDARRRSELLDALPTAMANNELFLMFQPQVSLRSNQVVGLEALLRWRLPSGEFISPEVFLPLAEQSGLAVMLGYQVISWALETGHRLRARGCGALRMAVNVSIPQFRDPTFVTTVKRALTETNSLPEQLELEITESVAGLGESHLIDVLTQIRALGVAIAIDDFGTGYSSLAYVDRLPADRLKVDRSFVSSLKAGPAGLCIARTIMTMGHDLGWTVLAEGVETVEQLEILKALGCDEVQGYFFAKPMAEGELVEWLAKQLAAGEVMGANANAV